MYSVSSNVIECEKFLAFDPGTGPVEGESWREIGMSPLTGPAGVLGIAIELSRVVFPSRRRGSDSGPCSQARQFCS